MNDAEERFAERLAEELEPVVGPALQVESVELTVGSVAHVVATLRVDARVERIEATAPDVLGCYRPLVERAAELRLGDAFRRVVEAPGR